MQVGCGVLALVRVVVEQRRTPPPSDQPPGLHVDLETTVWGRRVHGPVGRAYSGEFRLGVLLGVGARVGASFFTSVSVVGLDVLGEVVASHEPLVADWACEPVTYITTSGTSGE